MPIGAPFETCGTLPRQQLTHQSYGCGEQAVLWVALGAMDTMHLKHCRLIVELLEAKLT